MRDRAGSAKRSAPAEEPESPRQSFGIEAAVTTPFESNQSNSSENAGYAHRVLGHVVKPWHYLAVGLMVILLGYQLLAIWLRSPVPPQAVSGSQSAPINSLVLSHLISQTGLPEETQLSQFLSAEIATSLARSGLIKLVVSNDREFLEFGGKVRKATSALNVRWALAGTLYRSGDRQKANMFLTDGQSGNVVWSGSYDVSPDSSGTDRLIDQIVFDLLLQVYAAAKELLEARKPAKYTPIESLILAIWSPGIEKNSLNWQKERIVHARNALQADPSLGPAHAVLADKLALLANLDPLSDTPSQWKEAAIAAARAIALSPQNAEGVFGIGLYQMHAGDLEEAQRMMRRTLELSPRHTLARFWSKVVVYYCRQAPPALIDELEAFDAVLSTNSPARWQTKAWLARLHFNNSAFEKAVAAARDSLNVHDSLSSSLILIASLVQLQRVDEARAIMASQKQAWPSFTFDHYSEVVIPRYCNQSPIMAEKQRIYRMAGKAM